MKKIKTLLALALAACLALTALTGCGGETADSEETDTRKYGAAASDSVVLPEGMDSTARFATQQTDGALYVVFNGIQNRDTGYFSVPGGQLTFTMQATGESPSIKYVKVAVWKKAAAGTQYVEGTTVYFEVTGEPASYTITGLDPAEAYRLTVSYDSASYYAYGTLRVDGAAELGSGVEEDVA